MRDIHTIIFHCSASDNPDHDDVSVIRQWHLARGWKDVGYHYFVKKDGTIQQGRPIDQIGAHVFGHNDGTVGLCFSGRTEFTRAQAAAATGAIALIEAQVGKTLELHSHNEYTNLKTCPNFVLADFLRGKITLIKKID